MNRKSKGINAERDLVSRFWATGTWAAVRVAGSGSMHYPACDIVASNRTRRVAIECKVTKHDKKYVDKEDLQDLRNFCSYFGAEAWLAVRFHRTAWYFLSLDDLEEKESCYLISKEVAERKGLSFEDISQS